MKRGVVMWGLMAGAVCVTTALAAARPADDARAPAPVPAVAGQDPAGVESPPSVAPVMRESGLSDRLAALKAERASRIGDGRLRPAPRPVRAQRQAAVDRRVSDGDSIRCLTEVVYYEARGEALTGRQAVAQVVLNRLADSGYPDSVCGVVYERLPGARTCQFSFTCDGSMDRPRDEAAWRDAERIAREAAGGAFSSLTVATHYHNDTVWPFWRRSFDRITQLGRHIFYDGRGDRLNS